MFLGSLLLGFGLTPFFTLGLAYIEDSVSKESASIYLGKDCYASVSMNPVDPV